MFNIRISKNSGGLFLYIAFIGWPCLHDWLPLTLMLQVGAVKSPTRARASIADSASHYDIHCKRRAVDWGSSAQYTNHRIPFFLVKNRHFKKNSLYECKISYNLIKFFTIWKFKVSRESGDKYLYFLMNFLLVTTKSIS